MTYPLVITYTVGELYVALAEDMAASAKSFGLAVKVANLPDMTPGDRCHASWFTNEKRKPLFIEWWAAQLGEPFVFVDADAVFVREPVELEQLQGQPVYCPHALGCYQPAVVGINPKSHQARKFLAEWISTAGPHHSGDAFCKVAKGDYAPHRLPASYYCRWDRPGEWVGEPVVEQRQASRWYRGNKRALHPRVRELGEGITCGAG